MDLLKDIKKILMNRNLKLLLIYSAIGLLIICTLSGKSRREIQSISVSADEQYVGFFETGEGFKLRCYSVDGRQTFEYEIPSDLSAGGHCVVWFESDVLHALFYRTKKIASFLPDGTLINVSESKLDEYPPEFPGFYRKDTQLIYNGKNIEILYSKNSFAYWLLGAERCLKVVFPDGQETTIVSWTARVKTEGDLMLLNSTGDGSPS